jgi:hypothetical protein
MMDVWFTHQKISNHGISPRPMASVMLSEALQRNAKHEARLSNISGLLPFALKALTEILRHARMTSIAGCAWLIR